MNPNTFLKQLLFSTVRIVANTDEPEKYSIGTGFLILKNIDETQQQIFLVTNKHVIAKTDNAGKVIGKLNKGTFSFVKSVDSNPQLESVFSINIENLTDMFFQHPDESVDLAICNISNIYNQITQEFKQDIFIRTIPIEMIPSGEEDFDAIEDVLFVGYPNGLFDEKNHLPLMRRGITASPYEIDFNGNKKFIIDAQVFPGSSGSPVFIKEQNMKNGSLRLGVEKYFFVGVISKVFHRSQVGTFIQEVAPTKNEPGEFLVQQMIGLGICEKSGQIIDLIEIFGKNSKKS